MRTEKERVSVNRAYFEDGCLCIHDGLIQKLAQSVSDRWAVEYYELACRCTRNYKGLEQYLVELETCSRDAENNITEVKGRELRVEHVPDHAPEQTDYWFAWVDNCQWDGTTRNKAIEGALKKAIETTRWAARLDL